MEVQRARRAPCPLVYLRVVRRFRSEPPLTTLALSPIVIVIMIVMRSEVEEVKQVANGGHVAWNILVVVLNGIGEVVAAAEAESGVEHPVSFDELHDRGVLVISVADMAAGGEGRNGDHGNARAG